MSDAVVVKDGTATAVFIGTPDATSAAASAASASTSAASAASDAAAAHTDRVAADSDASNTAADRSAVNTAIAGWGAGTGLMVPVATRGIMAGAATTGPVYLSEALYQGAFVWSGANNAANVTADPNQFNYVAPTSDPTGASGAWVRTLDAKLASHIFASVPPSTTFNVDTEHTITPDAGGTTDWRDFGLTLTVSGSNSAQQIIGRQHRIQCYHSAPGNLTYVYGYQGFIRVNNNATLDGTVTQARGFEHHIALENAGSIGVATDFYAVNADLSQSTGAGIGTCQGFFCADKGHATAVTAVAAGFHCGNFTQGAPITAAFYSEMSSGTGKWAYYADGTAASALRGPTRIGDLTVPTNALEVKGFAKLSDDGTYTAAFYHELNSTQSNFAAFVQNSHASTPQGIRIRFTGSSPNNQTQAFIQCEALGAAKFRVWSDGSVSNSGWIKSSSNSAGVGYATGAGGTVTQATSKTTGVTNAHVCGQFTTAATALAAAATATFTVTNGQVVATDTIILNLASGAATAGTYRYWIEAVAAGLFKVTVENRSAGSLSEALVFNFSVLRAVNA